MSEWAVGSGSAWSALEGDPDIQPGAEVLVGRHREIRDDDNWTDKMDAYVGQRHVVKVVGDVVDAKGCRPVHLAGTPWSWRARDLVCLKRASGELTAPGQWLNELFIGRNREELASSLWSGFDMQRRPVLRWAMRAGILVGGAAVDSYKLDLHRFDMALGRDPEAEKPSALCSQVFGWALSPAEVKRVYENTLAGKFSCKKCLAPVDAAGMCEACAKPAPLMCARCGVQSRLPLERCRGRVSTNLLCADCFTVRHGDSEPHRLPGEDRSGEAVLDDLRRFVAGPCGRAK